MATPEVKAKNRIKRALQAVLDRRRLSHKLHWNGGGLVGTTRLDLDGVIAGHPLSIEVKRFDNKGKLSARQKMDIQEYRAAGAFSMVVDDEHSLSIFIAWVETIEPRTSDVAAVLAALMETK